MNSDLSAGAPLGEVANVLPERWSIANVSSSNNSWFSDSSYLSCCCHRGTFSHRHHSLLHICHHYRMERVVMALDALAFTCTLLQLCSDSGSDL